LIGQTVVVAGGSRGIGLALARLCLNEQARVVLLDRDADALERAQRGSAACLEIRCLDLRDEASVHSLFEGLGTIDHLATLGGAVRSGRIDALPVAVARASFEAKFWSQYYCARYAHVGPLGSITLFSGVQNRQPGAGLAMLASLSASIEALGKALALEMAPVRVNVAAAGWVDSASDGGLPGNKSNAWPLDAPADSFVANRLQATPPQRMAGSADLVDAVLVLMKNPYITGTVLNVDADGILVRQ
jgi:NAD(P)-dependent dehydrogenase (short-subunit alcohol dehydrogenase family)